MAAARHTAETCEGCEKSDLGVQEATIEGEVVSLCRSCNREVILGGKSLEEIGVDVDDQQERGVVVVDDDAVAADVTEDLLEELPTMQRTDYLAVVGGDKSRSEQADDRDVTFAAVSQNIDSARNRLREAARQQREA